MDGEKLDLACRDDQLVLLRQVLQASDTDAEEEEVKEELMEGGKEAKISRREGDLAAFSGAGQVTYTQKSQKQRHADERHPLFKRFRR